MSWKWKRSDLKNRNLISGLSYDFPIFQNWKNECAGLHYTINGIKYVLVPNALQLLLLFGLARVVDYRYLPADALILFLLWESFDFAGDTGLDFCKLLISSGVP